jgi:hypothetical protein
MARTRARLVTPVRRLVQLLLVAFVVIYFVLPQIAGARRSAHLLAGVNLWLIVLGVVLESCSILSYANLTRTMIHGTPPPYLTCCGSTCPPWPSATSSPAGRRSAGRSGSGC